MGRRRLGTIPARLPNRFSLGVYRTRDGTGFKGTSQCRSYDNANIPPWPAGSAPRKRRPSRACASEPESHVVSAPPPGPAVVVAAPSR